MRGSLHRTQPCAISCDTARQSAEMCSQRQGKSKSSGGNGSLPLVPEVSLWMGEASLSQEPTNGDIKMCLFKPFQKDCPPLFTVSLSHRRE